MHAWMGLAVAAVAAAPEGGVVLQPSWRPGQELTYRLTRRDAVEAGSELARTRPGAGGTASRTLASSVLSTRAGGGVTARLREGPGPGSAVIACFDADGAFVGASPADALGADLIEAMGMAFLPGYERPLTPGGRWAAIVERDSAAGGRDLVDVDLELRSVAVEHGHRLARIAVRFAWAGRADPRASKAEEPPEIHVDELGGTGEIVFDLDLGLVRHAEPGIRLPGPDRLRRDVGRPRSRRRPMMLRRTERARAPGSGATPPKGPSRSQRRRPARSRS